MIKATKTEIDAVEGKMQSIATDYVKKQGKKMTDKQLESLKNELISALDEAMDLIRKNVEIVESTSIEGPSFIEMKEEEKKEKIDPKVIKKTETLAAQFMKTVEEVETLRRVIPHRISTSSASLLANQRTKAQSVVKEDVDVLVYPALDGPKRKRQASRAFSDMDAVLKEMEHNYSLLCETLPELLRTIKDSSRRAGNILTVLVDHTKKQGGEAAKIASEDMDLMEIGLGIDGMAKKAKKTVQGKGKGKKAKVLEGRKRVANAVRRATSAIDDVLQ